jgi:hypothetical protein
MKSKFLGILLCILLLAGGVAGAQYNQPLRSSTTLDDDVPTWNMGNSWTYALHDFTADYDESGQKLYCKGSIDEFTWTVVDTSDGFYKVDFTGNLNCEYDIHLSSSMGSFSISGTIKETFSRMSGSIIWTQSGLELSDFSAEIRGLTAGKIHPLPFALPLPFKVTIDADLSTEFPLFDFPLDSNKYWALPEVQLKLSIRAGGIFGLIEIPITFTMNYPWTPLAFHCVDKTPLTVEAGTFDAWKITSTLFDLFTYYYAPEVGNLIQIDATMDNGEVHGELISTTYS